MFNFFWLLNKENKAKVETWILDALSYHCTVVSIRKYIHRRYDKGFSIGFIHEQMEKLEGKGLVKSRIIDDPLITRFGIKRKIFEKI